MRIAAERTIVHVAAVWAYLKGSTVHVSAFESYLDLSILIISVYQNKCENKILSLDLSLIMIQLVWYCKVEIFYSKG